MDVEDDPEMIWNRLKEKFERVSEAEAENANSQFLEFAHIESETALQTIARFNIIVLKCHDQGIVLTEQSKRRMFIMRPSKRYFILKQNFLLAPVAAQPTLETLKAQLQDIETDLKKNSVDDKSTMGQGHRADGEINWGQGSSSDYNRGDRGRGSGRGRGNGGGRENDKNDRGSGSGKGGGDVTCYCCGQKGHIKPNCPKNLETCT